MHRKASISQRHIGKHAGQTQRNANQFFYTIALIATTTPTHDNATMTTAHHKTRSASRLVTYLGLAFIFSFVLIIHYGRLTKTFLTRVDDFLTAFDETANQDEIPSLQQQQQPQEPSNPPQRADSLSRYKVAYAFLLQECDPAFPQYYRGALLSVLVNAQILESSGSSADIVVMIQMSHLTSAQTLPEKDVALLKSYPRVVLHYLPMLSRPIIGIRPKAPSSYQYQMTKFRILELTQYQRVIYLDPAVMLLCSLDYLMERSISSIPSSSSSSSTNPITFQENIIMAGNSEPAKTTFMMLRPGVGEYQQFLQIMNQRDSNLLLLSLPTATTNSSSSSSSTLLWNETHGWGHVIQTPDRWRGRYNVKTGTKWDFPKAHTDQGLLYHWTKYVKRNVSIFIGDEVEHYNGSLRPAAVIVDAIQGHECPSRHEFPHDRHTKPPYDLEGQMWHFWKEPPWMVQDWNDILRRGNESIYDKPYQMWYQHLVEVERRLKIRLDLKQLGKSNPNSIAKESVSMEDIQTSLQQQYAYVFLMAGCDPSHPRGYRGIMFNILIAAQILESAGSKADIVVMVQMNVRSKATVLPEKDVAKLQAYPNIVIHYLPKPTDQISFYELQLVKFQMLELTPYRRVLYLDADVMPLCNLDHLFYLSDGGVLKENVILANEHGPASGYFIMLHPGAGEYNQLLRIVEQRDERILRSASATPKNRTLLFDEVNGWGHTIQSPDRWRARNSSKNGRRWDFPAAFADAGLVYHWAKYVKKNVSIFIGNKVEHWSSRNKNQSQPVLEETSHVLKGHDCNSQMTVEPSQSAARDNLESRFWHFWDERPWMVEKNSAKGGSPPYKRWFQVLEQVKRRVRTSLIVKSELHRDPIWQSSTLKEDFVKSLERKYAYAFLIADCDPARPQGYRGLLFGIMVNAQILQNAGSTADIVVMVLTSHRTKSEELAKEDISHLNDFPRIVIHYLPKPSYQLSFYEVQLEKMRVLQLTRYRRVIFLDADVMPLCNLDFLFHLSEKGVLKDNMVMAGNNEPANGGFLMLRPGAGEFERVQRIIECRDAHIIKSVPDMTFDPVFGWGHVIKSPDRWKSRTTKDVYWNFSAGYGDQGLIYHWVKYVKKSASMFIGSEVENWSASNNESIPLLEGTLKHPLKGYECASPFHFSDKLYKSNYGLEGQIWHFCGSDVKPWTVKNPKKLINRSNSNLDQAYRMWFQGFDQVQRRLNVKLDVSKDLQHRSMMKHWTSKDDFKVILEKKKKRGIAANC